MKSLQQHVNEALVVNTETTPNTTISYNAIVNIIGIASQFNDNAFSAHSRLFTSLPQLIVHLKSMYIDKKDYQEFHDMVLTNLGIDISQFISEGFSTEDLKKDETYFVKYKDMEAYAQYVGKKANKYQFDNSGRIIELTEAEVKSSVVNESLTDRQQAHVKSSAIKSLSQFFRVSASTLNQFDFDGNDDIKKLTKALNSSSEEGTKAYYDIAIKLATKEVNESINESLIVEAVDVDIDKNVVIVTRKDKYSRPYNNEIVDMLNSDQRFRNNWSADTKNSTKVKSMFEFGSKDIAMNAMKQIQTMSTEINEAKEISSKSEFQAYAETVLKIAHGDEYDQTIVDKLVDDISKDVVDDNWGEAVGRLTSGLGN